MSTPRLYVEMDLAPGTAVHVDGRAGHYLQRVMRLRPGDRVVLFNGDGNDHVGRFAGPGPTGPTIEIDDRVPAVPDSPLKMTLVQAVSRGERMDYTLQKATELGVHAIRPLWSERVEVRLKGSRLERRLEHWRGVIISSCEQCGRGTLPELLEPMDFDTWLASEEDGPKFVLDPDAESTLLDAVGQQNQLALAVGPEGGFSEAEVERMRDAGVESAWLGPRVLRTETAGPAALAVLQASSGDLASSPALS